MGLIKTAKLFSKTYKSLLLEMIRTDFKLRYQGSMLGYVWSILKPLFLFAILYTVFTKFLRIGLDIPNYAISLLLGIVLWNFFAEATGGALKSIVGRGNLIRKVNIPRYLIPLATISSALVNTILNLIVVFIFILFASNTPLSLGSMIIFPLLLVELVGLTVAVGLFLSAFYVKYRDIEHIWEVVRQGLFYLTPIIYPLSHIPSETIQKLVILNPLAQIIQDSRAAMTYGNTQRLGDLYTQPLAGLIPMLLVLATLVISISYFRKQSQYFAENI